MCKTRLKNDIFCSKKITFPNHMMTNQIFKHPNVYFDVIFLIYVDTTFLSPIMHIFQYITMGNKDFATEENYSVID